MCYQLGGLLRDRWWSCVLLGGYHGFAVFLEGEAGRVLVIAGQKVLATSGGNGHRSITDIMRSVQAQAERHVADGGRGRIDRTPTPRQKWRVQHTPTRTELALACRLGDGQDKAAFVPTAPRPFDEIVLPDDLSKTLETLAHPILWRKLGRLEVGNPNLPPRGTHDLTKQGHLRLAEPALLARPEYAAGRELDCARRERQFGMMDELEDLLETLSSPAPLALAGRPLVRG